MEIPITSQSNIKNPSSGKAVPFIDSSDNIFKCKLSDGSLIKFDPSGSGSGTYTSEYYKCASVSSSSEVGNTLIVSGGTDIMFSYGGTYNIVDKTKSGYERMWKHESNDWYILSSNVDGYTDSTLSDYYWILVDFNPETAVIQPVKNSESILFDTNLGQHENPWDVTSWTYVPTSETKHDITITSSSTTTKATSGGTWSGYKAIFDSSAGTWSFESNVTEGLTYIGITPIVNKIYSADTTIQVGYIKLDGILNDETVKFLLYPKLNGTLEDVAVGGNNVTVTNTGNVAIENNRIVFGSGKKLTIPANTLPNDIFISGSPFLIEFQGIIPTYTSVSCCPFARKEGSMYYDRLDMYLNTIEGSEEYGKITIGYWTNDVDSPVGVFTIGNEHVIAFEYDGNNTSRVYVDGIMKFSFTGTSYLPFRTLDFYIGHDTDAPDGSNGNPFVGNMSYFRIRNVAPYQGSNYTPEYV